MPKITFVLAAMLVGAGIAVAVIIRFQRENARLQEQTVRIAYLSADNRHLSNSVAELRAAQAEARGYFQELVGLRSELKRTQSEQSNSVPLARFEEQERELARLQSELTRLNEQNQTIEELRDEIYQLQTFAAATQTTPSDQQQVQEQPSAAADDQPLSLLMLRTQGDTFAEKLKRSVGADDSETFQDVFGRFLQTHGIQTSRIAAAAYDSRTGRVIVRAPQATLDEIERVTTALDREP